MESEWQAEIKRWRENWYLWRAKRGCYEQQSREWLRGQIALYLAEQGISLTVNAVSNVEEALKAYTLLDDNLRPPRWINDREGVYVSFKNGILNMDDDELQLIPHSPEFFTLVSVPYDFNPEATCPKFEDAVNLWMPDSDSQMLLQDWAGYIFMPGNPEQVFLLNQGEGGDGKSQWATVLRALVGDDNVSGVGLEAFDPKNRFGLMPLLGKVLNIVGDANDIEKMGEGVLKAIVGGDPITIDRKMISAVTERLDCKFMMNCNQLPPFRDRSEGIWRRMLLVVWNQVIPEEKKVRDFGDVVVREEIQGIFNWALCGYHRVRKYGFTTRKGQRIQQHLFDARNTIQKERAFFEDEIGFDPNPETEVVTPLDEIVKAYRAWCERNNNRASLYGDNLAKAMISYLRTKHPEHSSVINNIKVRRVVNDMDVRSKRRWVYRGVYILRDAVGGPE